MNGNSVDVEQNLGNQMPLGKLAYGRIVAIAEEHGAYAHSSVPIESRLGEDTLFFDEIQMGAGGEEEFVVG